MSVVEWVRPRLRNRLFPWLVVGLTGLLAVPGSLLILLATWLAHQDAPPPCYGLGWGCGPDPGTTGAIAAALWLYALAWVAGTLALTELFWRRVALARSVVALGALLVAIATVLVAAVAVLSEAIS